MNINIPENADFVYIAIGCANNELQEFPPQILSLVYDGKIVVFIHIDRNLENYDYPDLILYKIKKFVGDEPDWISWDEINNMINNILEVNEKTLVLLETFVGTDLYSLRFNFTDPTRVQLSFIPFYDRPCFLPLENEDFNFIVKDGKFVKFFEMSGKEILSNYDGQNQIHRNHLAVLINHKVYLFTNIYSYEYRNNINKIPFYEFLIWWEELKTIIGTLDLSFDNSYTNTVRLTANKQIAELNNINI